MSRQLLVRASIALVISLPARASQSPGSQAEPATRAAAVALMQANNPAGAAKLLEALTEREPKNGRAWRNLAGAYQSLGKLDQAADALLPPPRLMDETL